jgi:ABC-type multidrug transport system ATPase subunit
MFEIHLQNASKRFQYEWIFKNLNLTLSQGDSIAITGSNGSGKSTLLKCISGAIPLSSGTITYKKDQNLIADTDWFTNLSISAPYMELPEEFMLKELLEFHFQFKTPINKLSIIEMMEIMYLEPQKSKPINQFSSGMKQRLKLGLAFFSDVDLVLLDEPTSNLDQKGIDWYRDIIERFSENRTLVICSNEPREYDFCKQKLTLEDFKQ